MERRVFEDYFSELQADMVDICLEYVEDRAEKIYIYCSFEDNVISSGFFYKINGKVVQQHKLNDAINWQDKQYDVSISRQEQVVDVLNDDIKSIIKLCKEYHRDMPTQIKLIYDITNNSLNADYCYDIIYSNDAEKFSDDILEEWYLSEKEKEEETV